MRVLLYHDLDPTPVQALFDRAISALRDGNLRQIDVKKLQGAPYYRAKLNDTHRLLLDFRTYHGERVCLVLEVILHHRYHTSRFLRGAAVHDDRFEADTPDTPLRVLPGDATHFHLPGGVVAFSPAQQALLDTPLPAVMIGTAGSGKTTVTLEKLRTARGAVAYVTLNELLARQAERLYHQAPTPPTQHAAFLSLQTIITRAGVTGAAVSTQQTLNWLTRQPGARFTRPDLLLEEFRGVIGAPASGPLGLDAYLALGERRALYLPEDRPAVHALFSRYQAWLSSESQHDPNDLARAALATTPAQYDVVFVDEVQDFTPAQLALALRLRRQPGQFALSGDSNQIVHPNFFAWADVRDLLRADQQLAGLDVQVLTGNYRNARRITDAANQILRIKYARFGSVDRESAHLMDTLTEDAGEVSVIPTSDQQTLSEAISRSAQHAVLVLREEDKPEARRVFRTPLVFSVQEAKGLEYSNVILYRAVSGYADAFREIAADIQPDQLPEELTFRRARDRRDRSLEQLKFYVNALFVAFTRAQEHLMLVEDTDHPMLRLLRPQERRAADVQVTPSSAQDWTQEAERLERHGNTEQARAVREQILRLSPVPWPVTTQQAFQTLRNDPSSVTSENTRTQQQLLHFLIWHQQRFVLHLIGTDTNHARARDLDTKLSKRLLARMDVVKEELREYTHLSPAWVLEKVQRHGADFPNRYGTPPLTLAAMAGNSGLTGQLREQGASVTHQDLFGFTPLLSFLNYLHEVPSVSVGDVPSIIGHLLPDTLRVRVYGQDVTLWPDHPAFKVLTAQLALLKGGTWQSLDPLEHQDGPTADAIAQLWQLEPRVVLDTLMAASAFNRDPSPAALFIPLNGQTYGPNPELAFEQPDGTWLALGSARHPIHRMELPSGVEETLELARIHDFPPARPFGKPLPRHTDREQIPIPNLLNTHYTITSDQRTLIGLTLIAQERGNITGGTILSSAPPSPWTYHLTRTMRLLVPNDDDVLSAVLDDPQAGVIVSGPALALSDDAINLLLHWAHWRVPSDAPESAFWELNRHGFQRVINDLGEMNLHPVQPPAHLLDWRPVTPPTAAPALPEALLAPPSGPLTPERVAHLAVQEAIKRGASLRDGGSLRVDLAGNLFAQMLFRLHKNLRDTVVTVEINGRRAADERVLDAATRRTFTSRGWVWEKDRPKHKTHGRDFTLTERGNSLDLEGPLADALTLLLAIRLDANLNTYSVHTGDI